MNFRGVWMNPGLIKNNSSVLGAKGDTRDVTLPLVQIPSAGSSLPALDQSASFLHPENPLHGMNRIPWNLQLLSQLKLRKQRRWLLWHFTAAPGL